MVSAAELTGMGFAERPAALWSAFVDGLDGDELAAAVWATWTSAIIPCRLLTISRWRALWRAAGFMADGARAARPDGSPRRVWRAAAPGYERALSWTTERWVADIYRNHANANGVTSNVFTALVPGDRLLAHIDDGSMWSDREIVADVRGLALGRIG